MTTITLLAVAFCLCAVPSLGSYNHRQNQGYPPRYPFIRQPISSGRPTPLQTYGYQSRYYQRTNGKVRYNNRAGDEGYGQGEDGEKGGYAQGLYKTKSYGYKNDSPNPPDAVAFSGNRKTTQYFFQPGPVIFDDVTTNIGGAYNSDYGVFTAFEAGIYQVSYNVVSPREGKKTAAVDLLRNEEVINSASGRGYSGETSNSAVVFLDRWDQLSVQGRAESAVYCGEGGDDAFCSFNVALLKLGSFVNEKARKVPGW